MDMGEMGKYQLRPAWRRRDRRDHAAACPTCRQSMWNYLHRRRRHRPRRRGGEGRRRQGFSGPDAKSPAANMRSTATDPQGAMFGLVGPRTVKERDDDREAHHRACGSTRARRARPPNSTPRPSPTAMSATTMIAPGDYPGGKKGDELTVDFTVLGRAFSASTAARISSPTKRSASWSSTEDQAETDRYWNAIVDNGGAESECGWCKDKWGFSWQITPRVLLEGDDRSRPGGRQARVRRDDDDAEDRRRQDRGGAARRARRCVRSAAARSSRSTA